MNQRQCLIWQQWAVSSGQLIRSAVPASYLLLGILMLCSKVAADPLTPSLLEITEQPNNHYNVLWRTPTTTLSGSPIPPRPTFPANCSTVAHSELPSIDSGLTKTRRWQVYCPPSLVGEVIGIEPIKSYAANGILRIKLLDGRQFNRILTPTEPHFIVPSRQSTSMVFGQFLRFGAVHLATGLDHILFLITLIWLTGINRRLLLTLTLFTIAHSITLGLTTLNIIVFPAALAEALIALSIVGTAAAAIRLQTQDAQQQVRGARRTNIMVFGFGLFHGLGFANALQTLGLPPAEVGIGLIAFNLGLEFSQLALIGLLVILRRIYQLVSHSTQIGKISLQSVRYLPHYSVGIVAAIWFWQRLPLTFQPCF